MAAASVAAEHGGDMGHTQASGGPTEEGSRAGVAAGSATADASAHVPTDAVAASGIAAVTPSVAAEHGGVWRTPPGLTAATAEHGAARAGAANPVARGPAQAGAAEHGGAPAEAPGDAPVLHLSAMDLQRMQREIWPQQGERLHQEARTWLDRCANGDDDAGPVDLATLWPKWGRWLASLDGCVEKKKIN